jgi:hypothetical protein
MSMAETRTALATAASTVSGVACAPYYRQSFRAGDAAVRIERRGRDDNGYWLDTWQVWVALNQDAATAEQWLDAHLDDLTTALSAEMTVTTITPADIALASGGGSINGVIVEGVREG